MKPEKVTDLGVFTGEEKQILESAPDWYVMKLLQWAGQVAPNEVLRITYESVLRNHPHTETFLMVQQQIEKQMFIKNRDEVVTAIKRKFIEEGFPEERSMAIADDYIGWIEKRDASIVSKWENEGVRKDMGKEINDDIGKFK